MLVVGLDGSEESLFALRWAVEEARLRQDRIQAVMVYDIPPVYAPYGELPGAGDARLLAEARRAAEDDLERALATVEVPEDVTVDREVIEDAQPARTLTERAGQGDLLVVGSRGRGGFKGLLLGSVSQQCVQHAQSPVVVVRTAP